MRHPESGSVAKFAEASRVPVINGGDGPNEHPSQALLDLYTMRTEIAAQGQSIDGLSIALIGDLRYGRAVHFYANCYVCMTTSACILFHRKSWRCLMISLNCSKPLAMRSANSTIWLRAFRMLIFFM